MVTDVLLGHSFIRRLRDYMNNNHVNHNLRLHPVRFIISSRAQGGLNIDRLIHERSVLFCYLHTSPKIIYLQIGGNDLSSTSSDMVPNEVYSFASFLHYGIQIPIVIGQLLWRDPSSTNQNYDDKVNEVNAKLLHITRQDNNSCIMFWIYHVFWSDLSFLGRDGVHLNFNGMFKDI
jgi:lysophospholipase L1-like esterase